MVALNLPPFDHKLKVADGKVWIFDGIRKKYVVLTPEEWVRQHVIHYLTDHLHYPKSLLKVEATITYNQLNKRSDIVVFNRQGSPWMIVECKAPEIALDEKTALQVATYNKAWKADYVMITNGLRNVCYVIADPPVSQREMPAFPL